MLIKPVKVSQIILFLLFIHHDILTSANWDGSPFVYELGQASKAETNSVFHPSRMNEVESEAGDALNNSQERKQLRLRSDFLRSIDDMRQPKNF